MDQRWIDAAQGGDVDSLYTLLKSDQTLFQNIDSTPLCKTPLHVAVLAGQTRFAKEILVLKPAYASKLDEEGFSPIHLASATGQVELVKEFLALKPLLYKLQGREKKTPLHCAVIAGKIEVINLLLDSHVESLLDQTSRNETVFHLAVKNNQLESFRILLEWLDWLHQVEVDSNALRLVEKNHRLEGIGSRFYKTKLLSRKELQNKIYSFIFESGEIQDYKMIQENLKKITGENPLNWKDDEGNTVLHLATSRRQLQIIEVLLGGKTSGSPVDVNALNMKNLTALDILLQLRGGNEDNKIEVILRCAGAVSSGEIISASEPDQAARSIPKKRITLKSHVSNGKLHKQVLLVAILLALVCFYSVLNPPGGVRQYDHMPDQNNSTVSIRPGMSVLGRRPYLFIPFMLLDIAGFLTSLILIAYLAMGSPIKKLILMSLSLFFGVYVVAVISIAPSIYLPLFVQLFITFLVAILVFCATQYVRRLKVRAQKGNHVQDEEMAVLINHTNEKA